MLKFGAPWTPEDDAVIRSEYPAGGWLAVKTLLADRTQSSIQQRACKLNIRMDKEAVGATCQHNAREYWALRERYHFRGNKPLRYESGEMIPLTVCLCAAHSANECCCGAWDIPLEPDTHS